MYLLILKSNKSSKFRNLRDVKFYVYTQNTKNKEMIGTNICSVADPFFFL